MNEWYITIGLAVVYTIAFVLPRRLHREIVCLLFVWGFTVAMFWDFTIGGGQFDFYDVCDSSHLDVFDFVSYFLYAPFSYFYIYLYETLRIGPKTVGLYIALWALLGLGLEWVATVIHMITYKNGYSLFISFPIYLFNLSVTLLVYKWVRRPDVRQVY
jgi:hypothetical protein